MSHPSYTAQPANVDIESTPEKTHEENAGMTIDEQKAESMPYRQDAFGDESHAEVKYKVLKWWYGLQFWSFHPVTDDSSLGNVAC
jgi:hypothetical protein